MSNCRLKDIDMDVLYGFELDAVAGHGCFADRRPKGSGQVGLVFQAKDVHRDSRFVSAQADSIKLSCRTVSVFDRVEAVPDIGVGDRFAFLVLAVGEPQST